MAHEKAKQLLAEAKTYAERQNAIRIAIQRQMPLHEIEQYLDWLDNLDGRTSTPHTDPTPPPPHGKHNSNTPRARGDPPA